MKEGKPIFVYGTLRVGEWNFRVVEPALCDEPDLNCTTPGHLWFSHPNSYPVAQFTADSQDTIKGDLLWVDANSVRYKQTEQMEINSGYAVRKIFVTLADGEVIPAYGFHFMHTPNPEWFIPGGDWQKAIHEDEMPGEPDDHILNDEDWEEIVN